MKTGTLDAPARLAVTSTVGAPSDPALLRATSTLVRHERHLQGAVIDHLTEIEARRLYLRRGCSSLFDYTVRELGYRDAAAGRRIGAVRLCADQPDARERLRDGSLTLSAAAELQWAFDRQRRRGSIAGTASSAPAMPAGSAPENAVATEDPAAGSAPSGAAALDDPAADAAPHRTSAPPDSPPLVLDAAGRQKLVEEASGKSARQVRRMLADLDPDLAPPADRVRPLGDGRYELKAVIDADCRHGLEQLRGLLSPRQIMVIAFMNNDLRYGSEVVITSSGTSARPSDAQSSVRSYSRWRHFMSVGLSDIGDGASSNSAILRPCVPDVYGWAHPTATLCLIACWLGRDLQCGEFADRAGRRRRRGVSETSRIPASPRRRWRLRSRPWREGAAWPAVAAFATEAVIPLGNAVTLSRTAGFVARLDTLRARRGPSLQRSTGVLASTAPSQKSAWAITAVRLSE